jgi:hypothetical protein
MLKLLAEDLLAVLMLLWKNFNTRTWMIGLPLNQDSQRKSDRKDFCIKCRLSKISEKINPGFIHNEEHIYICSNIPENGLLFSPDSPYKLMEHFV